MFMLSDLSIIWQQKHVRYFCKQISLQVMFTSNFRIKEKWSQWLWVDVGTRWTGLSILDFKNCDLQGCLHPAVPLISNKNQKDKMEFTQKYRNEPKAIKARLNSINPLKKGEINDRFMIQKSYNVIGQVWWR